jgi:hypothetical protein
VYVAEDENIVEWIASSYAVRDDDSDEVLFCAGSQANGGANNPQNAGTRLLPCS